MSTRGLHLFLLAALLPGFLGAAQPSPAFLKKQVDRLIQLHGDGIALSYPNQRAIKLGHFFGAKNNDAIAFFVIEGFYGGNDHAEFIAFFQGNDPTLAMGKKVRPFSLVASVQAGGRMWRTFDWDTAVISPGFLTIRGKQWRDGEDPACCPSQPFTTTFRLHEGAIVEGD